MFLIKEAFTGQDFFKHLILNPVFEHVKSVELYVVQKQKVTTCFLFCFFTYCPCFGGIFCNLSAFIRGDVNRKYVARTKVQVSLSP